MSFATAANTQQVVGPSLDSVQTNVRMIELYAISLIFILTQTPLLFAKQKIGLQSVAADSCVRLFADSWPTEQPPPTSFSLLSVAQRNGLIAAAGPQGFVLCTASSIRDALNAEADSIIKPYKPQLEVPVRQQISHIAFTADESILLVVTQTEDGIAVYKTADLLANSPGAIYSVPLPNHRFRHFAVNPAKDFNNLAAAVTWTGELLVIDFSRGDGEKISGVLLDNCTAVAWSRKGKQLVAGRMDGTMVQMTPQGEVKAHIPRPNDLEMNRHGESTIPLLFVLLFYILFQLKKKN